jgi:hypothetical protein
LKKENIYSVLFIVAMLLFFGFPIENEITIIKDDITSIKPVAGKINDQFVTTSIAVDYWLKRDNQPDTATYAVLTTPFLRIACLAIRTKKV